MPINLINVRNLTVKSGSTVLLNNINFDVEKGDYISIIGPNGSGKTTLIKSVLGLITPFKGKVLINKNQYPKFRIGYLPQKTFQSDKYFPATVNEIINTGLITSKFKLRYFNKDNNKMIQNLLERLGIYEIRNRKIGSLSGGQQQRVLLARAIASNPSVLILDEPTSALDPQIREEFYNFINYLNKIEKVTIIMVSHDISTMRIYSEKILYLDVNLMFFGNYEEFCNTKDMEIYFGQSIKSNSSGGN